MKNITFERIKLIKTVTIVSLSAIIALGVCGCTTREDEQQWFKNEGIAAMNAGNYEQAVKSFESALEKSGGTVGNNEIDISYYKAAAQYNLGDFDGAEDTYTALAKFDEKNPYPLFLRGSIYIKEGEKDSALKDYKEAIARDEENYDLYIAIYENLMAMNMANEANEFLNIALEKSGDSEEDCIMRGKIYTIMKQYDAAKTAYEKAIDKGSEDANIYLAQLYYEMGETSKGDEILDEFKGKSSLDSIACSAIGVMEMRRGDYEEALRLFEKGLDSVNPPNKKDLLKNKIAAYEYMGHFDEALKQATEYLASYPADGEMQREIQFLSSR